MIPIFNQSKNVINHLCYQLYRFHVFLLHFRSAASLPFFQKHLFCNIQHNATQFSTNQEMLLITSSPWFSNRGISLCPQPLTQTPSDARGISPWSPRYTRIFPLVLLSTPLVFPVVFPCGTSSDTLGNPPTRSTHLPVEPLA